MENTKKTELLLSGLAQLRPLVEKVETLEDKYKISRETVLSEDLFWSENKDEVYRVLREHDTISLDLIRGLKKELQELMTLAATVELSSIKEEK